MTSAPERDLMLDALSQTLPEDQRPTRREVVPFVAEEMDDGALEAFISTLPVEKIPFYVLRLRAIAETARKLADALETEWGMRASGLSWCDPETGDWYDYKASSRGTFKDIPDLVHGLINNGLSVVEVARAISGLRVTDLYEAAAARADTDPAKAALIYDIVDDHRTYTSGPSHLTKREEKPARRGRKVVAK